MTEPLIKLKNAALDLAQVNYQQNIKSKGDDELTELFNAFNLMSQKLFKLEKIRKESTSDLAHELRTPLTTIKGYLEAIEDKKIKVDQESIREMQEETERMTILIEKLNEFADAQNKVFNLKKEKLNLTPIIKKVIKQQDNLLKEKNISLDLKLNREIYIIRLAVTKELMEAHQAEIKVESNGNGTLFKLIFKISN
ncbi:MAG: histidine kinase dimerization/phospho-acceptor domain-containing protein [Halanaerobium sp.]